MIDYFNNSYNILNGKSNSSIISFIILLIILFFICIYVIIFYKFYEYETCFGIVKKIDDYKVIIYLKEFNKLSDYEIYLDDLKIDFKISSISPDYYIINNENYYEIVLDVNLEDKYKIENNILNLTIRKNKITYFEKIKKGVIYGKTK